jgi:alpha-D-xyloside xylohydrolase
MPTRIVILAVAASWIAVITTPLKAAAIPVTQVTRQPDGVLLAMQPGVLRLQVWTGGVIRVTYAPDSTLPQIKSLSVIATPADVQWEMHDSPDAVTVQTTLLRANVNKKTGAVAFFDLSRNSILRESDDGKSFPAPTTQAVIGSAVRQTFVLEDNEGIYGLGQHQQGIWNYRGHTVHLQQKNMEVGLPVLLSSKGYGLLWDNPAITDIAVGIGDQKNALTWTSEAGKAIDYYFMYGPTADGVIRQYRALTGDAPMFGRWMWGFWQCKERYKTQHELVGIVQRYRDLHVPIDGIIQDWQYWPLGAWGSHQFDPARYPDPAAMIKTLHGLNVHVLISVWPKFDLGTPNIAELEQAGAMYEKVIPYVYPPGQGKWYDPFSADGRRIYWNQVSEKLFSLGIDGWWLDAPEPELSGKWGEFRNVRTAAGPGVDVFNAYPLMHSGGIYQGQRAQTDDKRVMILTRSAYAGQQRNAAIIWSGDIRGTWQVLKNQVPAGLNFSVSGIPYWNTDIGGFQGSRAAGNNNPADPRYRELFTRWFQYGSFTPLFRVHGTGPGKEFWAWDEPTQKIWLTYVNLRYRLIPYIYSDSWQVTSGSGTMMRPLVMDFADDPNVLNIGDQYLFGPAIMVTPVTTQGATTRSVYLPGKTPWYDFWTGEQQAGGKRIDAAAPIETMPLYVRAGSIVPMGPLVQYVNEKPDAPLEVRVYPGADGSFTLYEDEGDSYRYEKGAYSTISLAWNDTAKTLTIGRRIGQFPGMQKDRTIRVVFVAPGHGAGVNETEKPDQEIQYTGDATIVRPN